MICFACDTCDSSSTRNACRKNPVSICNRPGFIGRDSTLAAKAILFISRFEDIELRYFEASPLSKGVSERMVKSFLDLFVLAVLNHGSRHGYELMRELRIKTGVRVGPGTLYPLLYELEERKLVVGEWISPSRRSRKVYRITEQGDKYREQGFRGIDQALRSTSYLEDSRDSNAVRVRQP